MSTSYLLQAPACPRGLAQGIRGARRSRARPCCKPRALLTPSSPQEQEAREPELHLPCCLRLLIWGPGRASGIPASTLHAVEVFFPVKLTRSAASLNLPVLSRHLLAASHRCAAQTSHRLPLLSSPRCCFSLWTPDPRKKELQEFSSLWAVPTINTPVLSHTFGSSQGRVWQGAATSGLAGA